MGEVYRARDPRLGRDVAVKVLPGRLSSDPDARIRFEREARAVAALSHPNIVAIFDVGVVDSFTYSVAELLDGETLRNRLARDRMSWRQAASIAASIADGLAAAHAKGIIHRDLKPENIVLTADGQVKILDFGLARWEALGGEADAETMAATETQPGTVMGTVGYMSPEQVRGVVACAPSDLFSLGCVIYELVAGRRAFARETVAQTMTAILEQAPPSLGDRHRPVPDELARLVERCLEKDPIKRLQSARDLAAALRDLSSAAAPAVRRTSIRLTRAHAIGLVAVVMATAALYVGVYRPTASIDSIAVLPFENDSGNADMEYLSDGMTESLINSLSRIPDLAVIPRSATFRYKGASDVQAAGQSLHVRAVLTGRVNQRGDGLVISAELVDVSDNRQLWGQRYNRTKHDILLVQEAISTEISQALRFQLTGKEHERITRRYTENTDAYQLYLRGRYHWNKKTPPGFYKGIEYFEQAIAVDPNYAPAHAALAALYNNLANYNFGVVRPREAWKRAKDAAERAVEIDDQLASAHTSLALVAYQWEWDWPKAEREFKRALEIDASSPSTLEPSPASTYHWYAHFLMTIGRVEESQAAGRRALELDPLDLANNAHEGWHYLFIRDYPKAVDPLKRAIDLDSTFVVPRWYLGLVYEQQGAFDDAIQQFQECVRVTADRPSMVALLGHAYAVAGRRDEARVILANLLTRGETSYVPPYAIAIIYAGLGQPDEAFAWLERAYTERDSWLNYVGVDPRLDPLVADRRFAELLTRLKLTRHAPGR